MSWLVLFSCRTTLVPAVPSDSVEDGSSVDEGSLADSTAPTEVDSGSPPSDSEETGTSLPGCWLAATNDPEADDAGLAAGPITRFTIKVYYLKRPPGDQIIDPYADGEVWLAEVDDVIVFDGTQKNEANEICQWDDEPVWNVYDPDCAFERLNTTNPFLMQVRALGVGALDVGADIDGVASNPLLVEVR